MAEPVYWTTKDGRKLNVDDMDDNHVRNAFKMLLRKLNRLRDAIDVADELNNMAKHKIILNLRGDMAKEFNDTHPRDEDDFDPTE